MKELTEALRWCGLTEMADMAAGGYYRGKSGELIRHLRVEWQRSRVSYRKRINQVAGQVTSGFYDHELYFEEVNHG